MRLEGEISSRGLPDISGDRIFNGKYEDTAQDRGSTEDTFVALHCLVFALMYVDVPPRYIYPEWVKSLPKYQRLQLSATSEIIPRNSGPNSCNLMLSSSSTLRPFQRIYRHYAGHPFRLCVAAFKTVFCAHVFTEYFYTWENAYGASMLPTCEVMGDSFITNRQYRRGRNIKVGDMVTFKSVVEPGGKVIKRIIGMEGDYVMFNTPGSGNDAMIQVPEGHCWVAGDNLPYSRDSRHFGPMPLALIRGKIIAKVLPWSERRWIENNLEPVAEA